MNATKSVGLRLPVQATVNRTVSYGALADGSGVGASQQPWWQPVVQNLPGIISGIASLF